MKLSQQIMKPLLLTLLLFTFGTKMKAQRIAYVDINAILEQMEEYRQAQEELDRVAKEWRQDIKMKYDEIQSMYNKYQAEQVLLSDEMRKKREDEIMEAERQVRELQKDKFGPEGQLFEKRRKLVQPIQEKVYVAIEDYANSRGYDFIFDKGGNSGMIFSNPRYDKTEDLLQELGIK
jgi:outer membrane protein